MNQNTYRKENEHCSKNIKTWCNKRSHKWSKNVWKMNPKITPIPDNWDPNFGTSFLINFRYQFLSRFCILFWNFILDRFWSPHLTKWGGHKKFAEDQFLMAWDVQFLDPCMIPFGIHFGRCLGRLEIIKTCIFNKYQIMILTLFLQNRQILVRTSFWIEFRLDFGIFWHHRGVRFCFHFGQNPFLSDRWMFWIHFGILFGVPKWIKHKFQNRSQNDAKKHPCFPYSSKSSNFPSAPICLSPPFQTFPPVFCISNGTVRSVP